MSVICYDVYGNAVTVAQSEVVFRPAVYGIFIENEQVLLATHPTTGLWQPPGLILDGQVEAEQALQRYFRQLVLFVPTVVSLLRVEGQYRLDEAKQAWHLSVLYYGVKRPLTTYVATNGALGAFRWEPLADLPRPKMQFGYEAILAAQRHELLQK